MDPVLIAVTTSDLHPQAKLLFSICYSHANDGVAAVSEDDVCAWMGGISSNTLRRYRSAINGSGHAEVTVKQGILHFVAPQWCAPDDQSARDTITPDAESDRHTRTLADQDEVEGEKVRVTRAGCAPDDQCARHTRTQQAKTDRHTRTKDDAPQESARHTRTSAGDGGKVIVSRAECAPHDQSARDTRTFAPNTGRLVGNTTPTHGEISIPTNPPVPPTPKLEAWEPELSQGLLLEMGCESLEAIRSVANTIPFQVIRRHVFAWRRDPNTDDPGGLIYRIRHPDKFAAPPLRSEDRRSELYRRFQTPVERAEEQRRQQAAAEEERRRLQEKRAAAEQAAAKQQTGVTELWQRAMLDLKTALPASTFDTWVSDTQVLDAELDTQNAHLVVGVPTPFAQGWLESRLRPRIEDTLQRIAGRPLAVTFQVRGQQKNGLAAVHGETVLAT